MSIMGRNKGKRAERQAADFLYTISSAVAEEFGKVAPKVERNLQQTRGGGYDLIGTLDFAVEVKHHETLNLNAWWEQACTQAVNAGMRPILMYRQNNKPWRIQMYLYHQLENGGRIKVRSDITLEAFKTIWEWECRQYYGRDV